MSAPYCGNGKLCHEGERLWREYYVLYVNCMSTPEEVNRAFDEIHTHIKHCKIDYLDKGGKNEQTDG